MPILTYEDQDLPRSLELLEWVAEQAQVKFVHKKFAEITENMPIVFVYVSMTTQRFNTYIDIKAVNNLKAKKGLPTIIICRDNWLMMYNSCSYSRIIHPSSHK